MLLGRPVLPANEMARQFDATYGTLAQGRDLVIFFDGQERAARAEEGSATVFRQSWRRPKWRLGPE